jgi:hypothetical protein
MKSNFLKSKKTTIVFAIIAFIGGATFLNQSITGNVIIKNNTSFETIPFIGLSLIFCSLIMAAYSLRKKK